MIGYYVHHHGRGHLARATSVCAHLPEPATILTSLETADPSLHPTVQLPRDDAGTHLVDPTAGGVLHWAPMHDNGLRERMRLIAEWVAAARPNVMVVDVSVEVAMFVRLLGVPVVVMAMPGDRTDAAHDLVYRLADHIIAAWPRDCYEPRWLQAHLAKTTFVGGISQFDGRPTETSPREGRPKVLVLSGAGGSTIDMVAVRRCAAAHPRFHWSVLGVSGSEWVDDPWPALCRADVVISSAGQGSIADIAAVGRPAVIIAADRPYAEQHATSDALRRGGFAVVEQEWPEVEDWPHLLQRACSIDPHGWERWQTRGAAARAAACIERVATERDTGASP